MRQALRLFAFTLLLAGLPLFAASAPSVKDSAKRPIDYLGNWLVERFNAQEKIYGNDDAARDPLQVAMVATALLNNRRDYKESNGPFISEPVKYVAGKIKDDGSVDSKAKGEALLWIVWMFESTKNPAHAALLEKTKKQLEATDNPLKSAPKLEKPEQLAPAIDRKALCDTLLAISSLKTPEASVGGQNVNWAEAITTHMLKQQKKNGSFSDDIQLNALAAQVLNVCYKQLK